AGAVAIEHQHGCAQLGGDAHLTEQVLVGLGTHPNVAGTLVVSLGCETVQGVGLHRTIVGRGQRAERVGLQQAGGTGAAIRACPSQAPLAYATRPAVKGLYSMEAPRSRIAQKTGLAAAGAHVILSPLAEGLPAGCPVAPVAHVGIAPYARPFAADVDVMLEDAPSAGAAQAILEAIGAACRTEAVLE